MADACARAEASLSSDTVGLEAGPVAHAIDARWLMAYAVALASRRPGVFLVVRYETVDATGRPVTTTLYGSIYRGVTLTGPDRVEVPWPAQALAVGEPPALATVAVAANLAHVYTECARFWDPAHT